MKTLKQFPFINLKCPHILHGGDYNPEQWILTPEVWDEDIRLMRQASCNTMTVGVFSWASLEPHEGQFQFDWLDTILDKLASNGMFAVLATPSGSKPAWLSLAYPETCRMTAQGLREQHQGRHNHCRTSPVYREKCRIINTMLAKRYKDHPALSLWHVSNEYNGGECHCPHCYAAFRDWLKARYKTLEALNLAWWSHFWSHTITDWEQVLPVDNSIHGLMLDWKRFTTDQTVDFFKQECVPLRQLTPNVPVTTNFMGFNVTLDYWKLAREVDVIAWDSYPAYHDRPEDWRIAVEYSMSHNMNRTFKQKPFMLMECSPSVQNWKPVNKLKRPGLHAVEGLQCIAHGGDTVQYFQWRKGRGGYEKFHGAVLDHYASTETRVFKEVSALGKVLGKLDKVVGLDTPAEVAIVYDWENRWALEHTSGPRNEGRDYLPTCVEHYRAFWSAGVACDVINEDCDLSNYKVVVAPMLYMLRPVLAQRILDFVRNGGTFVTTYMSGVANESDLCFQNGYPGPLREMLGIWAEEIDALYDNEVVKVAATDGNPAGLKGTYNASIYCDVIHSEGAQVLATYGSEFYKGQPAATVNRFGKGQAFYIASRNEPRFQTDFYRKLITDLHLRRALGTDLPDGVTAQIRSDGNKEFIFVLGFNREAVDINLGQVQYRDHLTGESIVDTLRMPPYSTRILTKGSG